MKIVAFHYQGQPGVGLVCADLKRVEPFDMPLLQCELGALAIIELQARGAPLPPLLAAIDLADVQITAPLPRPRRNIFCVGKNYFAHAKELAGSGLGGSTQAGGDIPADPIIFTKVPESVVLH